MFFNRRLFREQAVIGRWKSEPLDALLKVTAPHEWLIVAALTVVMFGVVAWGVAGEVERTLSVDCELARPGPRHVVVSSAAGEVAELLAEVGERVEAGWGLVRIRMTDVTRRARLAGVQIDRLATRLDEAGAGELRAALRAIRTDLLDVEGAAAAGDVVSSPYSGEVTAFAVAPGQVVAAGAEIASIRGGSEHRLQAVSFVPPAVERRIDAGMAARVVVPIAGGPVVLDAEVRAFRPPVAAASVPVGVRPAAGAGREIGFRLHHPVPSGLVEGAPCRVRIVTARQAPVRLLLPSLTD